MKGVRSYLPKNQPELKLISLEDVVMEPVRWLWYPYIPLGKLSIIHGDPAEGKTTLALWIAAACSRGQALPGGENSEPLTVLYQTAEGGLGDTIKPRLLESKADLQKIYTIDETGFLLSIGGRFPLQKRQLRQPQRVHGKGFTVLHWPPHLQPCPGLPGPGDPLHGEGHCGRELQPHKPAALQDGGGAGGIGEHPRRRL